VVRIDSSQSEALKSGSHYCDSRDDLLIAERNDRLSQSEAYPEPHWSVAARAVFQWTYAEDFGVDSIQ